MRMRPVLFRRRRRSSAISRKEAIAGFLFVLPWIVSLIVFTGYPVLASIYFSFTEYNVMQPPRWIGLRNFEHMFTADGSFIVGVRNSAYYAFLSVPLGLVFALAIALLLNVKVPGIGAYRTLFYLPSLVPPVAATLVFFLLFTPNGGLVNVVLSSLGLPEPGWFLDPKWSKPTLVILSLWGTGSSTMIFLAGLKEVPISYLEAAEIDGAGPLRRFWHITIPLISPVILFNLVMGVIYSFQVFTQGFLVGGATGQPLESLLFYMVLIYRHAFRYFAMGYAAALGMVMFAAIFIITLIIFWTSGRWVYYEAAVRGR